MASVRLATVVGIRPIDPGDADALRGFHARLSQETTRRRFLAFHPELSPDEVARFTTVDHDRREALVALAGDDIVGVARYDRIGPSDAEVAVVVADGWQRHGVGTRLVSELCDRAAASGVRELVADAVPENVAIVRLLSRAGVVHDHVVEDGVASFRIRLEPR